jgi:hypothetical protein
MLPWFCVADIAYARPALLTVAPLPKPCALEDRRVNVSNPTPDPIRPAR